MEAPSTATDVSTGSSPVPSPITASDALSSMNTEERSAWEKTGSFPERIATRRSSAEDPSDVSAASSAATPDKPATDGPAASSAEQKPPKRSGHGGDADTRIQQLLTEQKRDRDALTRLQGELDALRRAPAPTDAKAASSAAAPTPQEYERFLAMPDAPKEESFDSYAKFTAAMSVFIADKRFEERTATASRDVAERGRQQALAKTVTSARERIAAYAEKNPEFASKVNADLLAITPASMLGPKEQIGPHHVLADAILQSEAQPQLLEHFSTPDGLKDWQRLMALPPADLLRGFGRIEAALEHAASAAPSPNFVSKAPDPATVLGGRPSEAADPVDAAVQSKNMERYVAEANKRDLARRRG